MKKFNYLVLAILITIAACNKKNVDETATSNSNSLLQKISLDGLNEECLRINDDLTDYDYRVAISDNPNFGKFSKHPELDIFIAGKSNSDLKINLNGTEFKCDENGQWLKQNINFKEYFGKIVNIIISDNQTSKQFSVYVPKAITAGILSRLDAIIYSNVDNILKWQSDSLNLSKKVALYYKVYDNEDYANSIGMLNADVVILDDDGSFNLNEIIEKEGNPKRINFVLTRGNCVSTMSHEKKVAFDIACYDSHEYIIKN